MKPPEVIYLQWHGDAFMTYLDDDDNEIPLPQDELPDPDSVTWSAERIYDADIPYRRDDQECVWRPVAPEELPEVIVWVPACESTGMAEPTYDYCPFCGNRIRVEEERDMDLHEGPMKTGGNKPRTDTPRPAIDPGAQRSNLAEARFLLSDDSPYIPHLEWTRRRDDLLTAIDALQGDPRD